MSDHENEKAMDRKESENAKDGKMAETEKKRAQALRRNLKRRKAEKKKVADRNNDSE